MERLASTIQRFKSRMKNSFRIEDSEPKNNINNID
jgi:hypothetical protein